MTENKKRNSSNANLRELHQKITGLLLKIKPRLSDQKGFADDKLLEDLLQISALAESFIEQRPKSNKNWQDLADSLDQEGVALWNSSGNVHHEKELDDRTLSAALKYAAYRLIEGGLESKPGAETLVHMLQLASKVGSALSGQSEASPKQRSINSMRSMKSLLETGKRDAAARVLMSAAKYEELLRTTDDQVGKHAEAAAQATMIYYASRMEAAWREGNDGVAQFMLQKITDNESQLSLLQPLDRERIASKLLEVGKSFLRSVAGDAGAVDPKAARDSVVWMQKAFTMIEHLEDAVSPGLRELKRSILRSLARAYFLSSSLEPENLNRAEASLSELITALDSSAESGSPEYQQLRWMRIAVLKRQEAAEPTLLEAFRSIIDHSKMTDADVTDLLQELRTVHQYHDMITTILRYSLQRTPELAGKHVLSSVDRLLLSLIHHCSKDQDHGRAMRVMSDTLTDLRNGDIKLPKISTAACLTLLWQFGDRHYNARRWSQAADWFLVAAHSAFSSMGRSTEAKCYRKAVLSLIQGKEYARAYAAIRHCPQEESATHYVVFLTAAYQGLEEEAIRAIKNMVNASDFDRRMLLLATQMAHEMDLRRLLLSVLEALLQTLQDEASIETEFEAITVVRCLIRLELKLLGEPGANRVVLVQTLISHLRVAKSCCAKAVARKAGPMISKDLSWLWRAAYNCAVQGCSEWDSPEDTVSDLFDISRELLEIFCHAALVEADSDIYQYLANASFAAISGRVFSTRRITTQDATDRDDRLISTIAAVRGAKSRIQDLLDKGFIRRDDDVVRVRSFLHVLRVFEVEILCHLKDWSRLLDAVGEVVKADALAVNTFEAVADILWVDKECPTEILFQALEAILHASLDRSSISVEKFARWLRAICTILLSRNTAPDRLKAIGYVEQAATVLETHGSDQNPGVEFYPMDERQWLLATAYNTGIECLHASFLDEAKRWFEASTIICRFIPDGEQRAEKISGTYTHLLSRYASGS
ncbi:hypothetical protein OE88DRAFT_1810744 [Heliocybe sulcata]|uniref:SPO22-domain-containing protein n=1 Tax=Heliocybe sulcata TaxID=5364 RepID=A0A5C3MRQ6_9AGAM|nr:hypothetical protein OE88DRAFT_1810744 [Heliocybe sulcata]